MNQASKNHNEGAGGRDGPRSVTTRAGLRVRRGLEGLNKGLGAR